MVNKKRAKKVKEKKSVKKNYEIFEIEKDGKEKTVEKIKTVKEKEVPAGKKEIEKENKILRNVLIGIGIFVLILLVFVLIVRASSHFTYKGVKFDMVKEGELLLYHTSFPVIYNGQPNEYNIYLRNDPRDLEEEVPATGTLLKIQDTVINFTDEFDCDGDEVIAIANLVNLYEVIGKEIMTDPNATCDELGRYMYINLQEENSTSVEKFGTNCYNININNCEILEGTERFIVGILVKINVDQSS